MTISYISSNGLSPDVEVDIPNLADPRVRVTCLTQSEIATIEGRRYYAEYDRDFTAGEVQYVRYQMPSISSGVYIALQNRDFKSAEGPAEIQILWNTSTYTVGTEIPSYNENRNSTNTANMVINEITTPADLGIIRESDFGGSGGFFSSSGAVSSELGFRLYSPDSDFVLRIENTDTGTQRIHVAYEWFEVPSEVFDFA